MKEDDVSPPPSPPPAVSHYLLIGMLLIEFGLTQYTHLVVELDLHPDWRFLEFTHVASYVFIVLMLIFRIILFRRGTAVQKYFDSILLWIVISYVKSGPPYNGLCMSMDVYNHHAYNYVFHYIIAAWIALVCAFDVFLKPINALLEMQMSIEKLTSIDWVLWLLLMLHPPNHALFTCIPYWEYLWLTARVALFALLYGVCEKEELAPVVLILYSKTLYVLLWLLPLLYIQRIYTWPFLKQILPFIESARQRSRIGWIKITKIAFQPKEKSDEDVL